MGIHLPRPKQSAFLILSILLLFGCATPTSPPGPSEIEAPSPSPIIQPISTRVAGEIRPPQFAGSWYPQDPQELGEMVDQFLSAVEPVDGDPIAIIVPHAGYVFSGSVAAYGFKQLQGKSYEVAIIIGADHQAPLSNPISIWVGGGFETPLGVVPVDRELAEALVASNPLITADAAAHEGEHAIEIELPFLQRVCPTCQIVPILMGNAEETTIAALTESLLTLLSDRKAVIIISSDLSHYPSYDDARMVDGATLAAIETGDSSQVARTSEQWMASGIPNLVTCACGQGPIQVAMRVAEGQGADTVTVLKYANSGDSPYGEKDQVVGYGAVMFWRYEPPNLTMSQKAELLDLARSAISESLRGKEPAEIEPNDPQLSRRAGAFVTLRIEGELRGCIGYMRGDVPLYRIVQEMAVAAASSDPRFPPLTEEELKSTVIEISVLSPMRRVTDLEKIQVGVHGLMIYHNGRQGVLLPQVPVEEGWDRDAFLENLCLKAGLPGDCWMDQPTLYSFTAIVFGEEE
jgi:AmmeMemoRadiSam system protein B/AmmeMemoRadiSam system protein A